MSKTSSALTILSIVIACMASLGHAQDASRQNALRQAAGSMHFTNGRAARKMIHFTFDDGPSLDTTRAFLDKLDDLHLKATFFLSGWRFAEGREHRDEVIALARETARRGHTVASHSFRHIRLDKLSENEMKHELTRADEAFFTVFGEHPALLRPPHGMHNGNVDHALAAMNIVGVNWALNPTDYSVHDSESVLRDFKTVLRANERISGSKGGVILMHDTLRWSLEGFQLIYKELMTRNCELIKTNEELYDVVDDIGLFLGDHPAANAAAPDPARQALARARTEQFCH